MTKELITNEYYVVAKIDEAVIDGQLQAEFTVSREVWSAVYGDSLVSTRVVCRGNANEVETYLKENGIDEVITKGL